MVIRGVRYTNFAPWRPPWTKASWEPFRPLAFWRFIKFSDVTFSQAEITELPKGSFSHFARLPCRTAQMHNEDMTVLHAVVGVHERHLLFLEPVIEPFSTAEERRDGTTLNVAVSDCEASQASSR
jgi:hypothetical protein